MGKKVVDYDQLFTDWEEAGKSDKEISLLIGMSTVNMSRKRKGHTNRDLPMEAVLNICDYIGKDYTNYIKEIDG